MRPAPLERVRIVSGEELARFCFRSVRLIPILLTMLLLSVAAGAQTSANPAAQELPRYLIYFDEFSAHLSDEAKQVISDAAKKAKQSGVKTIVVQARASATGTVETNKYLAMTRSSIVTDELEADGVPRAMVRQEPIGQTGSDDPTVYNRRVDIILER